MATALAGFRLKARRVGAGMSGLSAVLFGHSAQLAGAGAMGGASAQAFSLSAATGGGGSITIPDITFYNGIPAFYSIRQHFGAEFDGMELLVFGLETLPADVVYVSTLDAEGFDWDGSGTTATFGGLFVQVIPE